MILTRAEFVEYWNRHPLGLGQPDSALWVYERHRGISSQWFVHVGISQGPDYDAWCDAHCQGTVLCYSDDGQKQWYGFTDRNDIVFWLLKWS
jgi:hypothetical protein